jgi:uncharacterized protein
MKYDLINKTQQKTSLWSGGATTEIYIYPKNADYASRQFLWRVSSATVETDTSVFTPLPGINRWIMTFDGDLEINHKTFNHESLEIKLSPYETHFFDGGWDTTSCGQVRDFNLMLNKGCQGELKHARLKLGKSYSINELLQEGLEKLTSEENQSIAVGCYCVQSSFTMISGEKKIKVSPYELLLLQSQNEAFHDLTQAFLQQEDKEMLDLVLFYISINLLS